MEFNFYKNVEKIDQILSKGYSKPAEKILYEIIKNDKTYENYLFGKLNSVEWFLSFKQYYAPENNQNPIPSDQEGFFTIPEWNVLPYLEKVSQQVNTLENEKYINELLTIIKDLSNYKDTNEKHIDNYRTWWYFVKILLNIPNDKIPIEIIDLIPIWLDSKFRSTLQGTEITTKLLPKFLVDGPTSEDIEKAEKIIGYITFFKLKPEEKDKLLKTSYREKYEFLVDPYRLEKTFEKFSKDIGEKCSEKVINDLVKKIKTLLKPDKPFRTIELGDKTYSLVLSGQAKVLVLKILDISNNTKYKIMEAEVTNKEINGPIVKELLIGNRGMVGFVNKAYKELKKEIIFQGIKENYLKWEIHNLYCHFHNEGTYKSFYHESEHSYSDPLEMLTFILKRILLAKAKTEIEATGSILQDFLNERFLYFPKMALYVIGNCMENHGKIFWEAMDASGDDIILEDLYFNDELRHVLENLKDLSKKQKDKLKIKIEKGPKFPPDKDTKRRINEWKQERYKALVSDPFFKKLHDDLNKQTGMNLELKPAIGEITSFRGTNQAPLTKDEILKTPNRDLVKYLADFEGKDFWSGPTVDGLASTLKEAVVEQPGKFINDLHLFLQTPYFYVYKIISAFDDTWNNKKIIDWEMLFHFILEYINRPEFWEDKFIIADRNWNVTHLWVVGQVAALIQDGTKDDSWVFSKKHFKKAEEIIFLILNNLKAEDENEKEIGDYVTHALNTANGKGIIALIYLALRIARFNDKKGEKKDIKWAPGFKEKYDQLLDKMIIEAFTFLGQYLPQLFWLDKGWAIEKIDFLSNNKKEKFWEAFMSGYLGCGKVYDEIYKLMKPHYKHGIGYDFKEQHDQEYLIQHICIGYLRGNEKIGDNEGLFRNLIAIWNPEQIKEILGFFWMQRGCLNNKTEGNEKIRKNVIEFWKLLYEKYKDEKSLNKGDRQILSKAAKLAVFLPRIDSENFNWLKLSAPYVHEDYDSPFFIEYLNEIKDKGDSLESPKQIGELFLKMLENFTPDYDKEHIRSIVEFLYQHNSKDNADKICNIFGSRGDDFLRDIYEKVS